MIKNLTVETAYLGSKGTNLFNTVNVNQAFLAGGPLGSGSQQSRRLYPSFSSITLVNAAASSTYHSLQFKVERRFSGGLSLLSSYLWGKALETSPTQDTLGMEKALASFDTRQRLSTNFIYEIPLGAGHTYLTGGLPKQVLGGWQASGILVRQGGRPVTAGTTGDLSNTGGSTRPNIIGDPVQRRPDHRRVLECQRLRASGLRGPLERRSGDPVIGPGYAVVRFLYGEELPDRFGQQTKGSVPGRRSSTFSITRFFESEHDRQCGRLQHNHLDLDQHDVASNPGCVEDLFLSLRASR